ncbi:hypothetical protein ACOBQJ_09880 [Pelotomaculum propionicicum]|uniref:hypothetical protein n=1 Tax=Pelotomaculum propionicicum TaxID=258475 RepID=UPI003B7F1EF3
MVRITKISFYIACIIGSIVAVWHFFVPYSSEWFSYIPDAPTEIIQSINYINFCFSFLLAGISLLLIIVQKKLFDGSKELRIFYAFFTLVWLSRIIIQLIWPWPSSLQLWLVVAFSMEFIFALIPMIYLLKNTGKQ